MNVGNDHEFTINELVEVVREIFPNKELTVEYSAMPKDDPKRRKPDLGKAYQLFPNWTPRVSLKEGLVVMKEWLAKETF